MNHINLKHALVWLLIAAQAAFMYGCSTTNYFTLPPNEVPPGGKAKIVTVIMRDGELIRFGPKGGHYLETMVDGTPRRVIAGEVKGKNTHIDPAEVLEVKFEQTEQSTGFGAGFLLGIPVGAGLFYLLLLGAFR